MAAAQDFHALNITGIAHDPAGAVVVTFDVPPALAEAFRFKPGQHVAVRAMLDGDEVRRTYSICAGPDETLRFAIKRDPDGRFSSWANGALRVGQTLDVMPPAGRFVLPKSDGSPRHVIGIAAGSGITPVLGIARQVLLHEPATRMTLIYGNRTRETMLFAEELDALKDLYLGRFEVIHVMSRPGEMDTPLFEGRITGERIAALGERLVPFAAASHVFLCGPGGMIKDVRDRLLTMGVGRERVVHEFFAPPGGAARQPKAKPPVSASDAAAHDVTVVLDGARHRLAVAAGQTVLDAALTAGLKVPYSCQGGMCSTCRARVEQGSATMTLNYSLEPWEIERGFTLTCQAVPSSPTLVIDFDAM